MAKLHQKAQNGNIPNSELEKHKDYLDDPKNSFIPASFQGFPMLIGIKEPYKIDSTYVASMIAMANPLHRGKKTQEGKSEKKDNDDMIFFSGLRIIYNH